MFHLEKDKGRGRKEGEEKCQTRELVQINAQGAIEWQLKITLHHSKNGHLDQFVKITQAQNFPKYYDELSHKASWDRNRLSCGEVWVLHRSR